jgi:hypothetical protein
MPQENNSDVFDISTFCKSNKISRALFYVLQKTGNGPRIMKVGRRTLITPEAVAEWRKKMEQQSTSVIAKRTRLDASQGSVA